MPVPGFLSSIADKAQSAIQGTPLAQHLPSGNRPVSPDSSNQPTANQAATGGSSHKSHTLEAIQHQLRTFGQQYSTTSPTQRIITTGKGVALDIDSHSRDAKSYSKELYTWGQTQDDDLRDVSDRLAYLNFVSGSLASTLAVKIDSSRSSFKALRDSEASLGPRRAARINMETQIARIEHDQQKGMEKRLTELKSQLAKAEQDDAPLEKEVELLKRKAVRDSERIKWDAVREYAEKLVLLSQAAEPIIGALPTLPPTKETPYTGATATAAARASLQRALDNYRTGHINLPSQASAADLSRSDTRSFGETHAHELSSIGSEGTTAAHPGIPMTPPANANRPLSLSNSSHPTSNDHIKAQMSPPPPNLNLAPAAIPSPPSAYPHPSSADSSTTMPAPTLSPETSHTTMPGVTPTVAETGVPVSGGPGPASGSLRDIKGAPDDAGPRSGVPGSAASPPVFGQASPAGTGAPAKFETAEEEKQRLAREDRERVLATGGSVPASTSSAGHHETAQEEKDRLQREERERVLRGAATGGAPGKEEDLPPYQDY